jgi:hypothetical protein
MDQRRLILLTGLLAILLALSGCSAAGSLEMQTVNDTELADAASRSYDPAVDRPRGGPTPPTEILQEAVSNDSATVTDVSPPIEEGLPFVVDGRYYNVSHSVINESRATRVPIRIDYNGSAPNGTAIDYDELPAVDQAALDGILPPHDVPPTDGFEVGVGAVYTDSELRESVLAAETEYDVVVYEGERYPIRVDEQREVTVQTYRYVATEVANSTATYAEQLREEFTFSLSNLSDDEASVLSEAIDDGTYYAEDDDDEGFGSLVDRFQQRQAITSDRASGLYLVRYRGDIYLVDLHYGGFLGEET